MIKFLASAFVLLGMLQASSAAPPEVWALTLLARDDSTGACEASADSLGKEIQDAFNAAVPGFTNYVSDESTGRFLRSMQRDLQINLCSRSYCNKPRNWQTCLWNGCSCSCGQRRELVSSNASDNAKILKAKREIDDLLEIRSVELGCELGLVMQKARA